MDGQTSLSYRQVSELLSLQESRLRYWSQTGLVGPSLRRGGRQFYTFSDLIQVKATRELLERGIPLRRVRRAIEVLRSSLPELDRPLSRLRVCSDGERVVVLADDAAFEPVSGQMIMEFGLGSLCAQAAQVVELGVPARDGAPESPLVCFENALLAEESEDLGTAESLYLRALEMDPNLAAAHTNLGTLAYRRGQLERARDRYERAIALCETHAEAHFNLANLLAEQGSIHLAIAEYRRAISSDPDWADPELNLAALLDEQGAGERACLHYARYLMLAPTRDVWSESAERALERLQRDATTCGTTAEYASHELAGAGIAQAAVPRAGSGPVSAEAD